MAVQILHSAGNSADHRINYDRRAASSSWCLWRTSFEEIIAGLRISLIRFAKQYIGEKPCVIVC